MNKFNETKTRPSYSYKIQRIANGLPFWSKARQDKHSNYQSVLSDLNDQIEDLTYYAKLMDKRQSVIVTDIEESGNIYRYWNSEVPKLNQEGVYFYSPPVSIKASSDLTGSEIDLVKCPYRDVDDLNNRIELQYKDYTESTVPYDIVSVSENNMEWLLYIRRNCFLGFELTAINDYEINPEDFYIKENGVYIYNIVYLNSFFNTPIQALKLLPGESHVFFDVISPGFYYLKFDLLDQSLLNNFTINIVSNGAFSKDAKLEYHDTYADDGLAGDSYLRLDGDNYLQVVIKDYQGNKSDQIVEGYLLLNEDDESVSLKSWCKKERMIYGLDTGGSKLYMYNTFSEGNSYIYQDNADYLLDIVCEKIDYKPGDEITLEVRPTYVIPNFKIRQLRIKVENYESSESYYINDVGTHVVEDAAWRTIEEQVIKWKFNIDNIGSYKFTLEVVDNDRNIITAGVKLILVNYKAPYKVFDLEDNYDGWALGVNPDNKIELTSAEGEVRILNFHKDGYFFDENTGIIWANVATNSLIVEY